MEGGIARGRLVRASALIAVSGLIATAIGYLYQTIMGRMLGPAAFGTLAALLAVWSIVERVFSTVQLNVARVVAQGRSQGSPKQLVGRVFVWASGASLLAAALFLALLPLVRTHLSLDLATAILFAASVALAGPSAVVFGVAYGENRMGAIAAAAVAGAMVRIGLAVALVIAGLGVAGAYAGNFARAAVILVVATLAATSITIHARQAPGLRTFAAFVVPIGVGSFALAGIQAFDVMTAKLWLSSVEAGHYAGAALFGKLLLIAPTAISAAMFPLVAERAHAAQASRSLLHRALALHVGAAIVATAGLYLAGERLAIVILGPDFPIDREVLVAVAIGAASVGVLQLLFSFTIARGRRAFVVGPIVALLAQAAWLLGADHTPLMIALSLAFAGSLGTLTVLAVASAPVRARRS